ncbi:glycosyl hydrolase-related protein [Geminisphaera colitermitum]|uniref:glycosyl hydrolase-related protein n=1 Tax=Geminisphaera colitermitum TaxID=1148786 RepID=UPI000694B7B8|nr:glycosyl hydrolase-related protein [Geminisphaera colitermitum]
MKLAEDDSGDLILRLYESARAATRCHIRIQIPGVRIQTASETTLLETPLPAAAIGRSMLDVRCSTFGDEVAADFRPFEIKTLRLRMA